MSINLNAAEVNNLINVSIKTLTKFIKTHYAMSGAEVTSMVEYTTADGGGFTVKVTHDHGTHQITDRFPFMVKTGLLYYTGRGFIDVLGSADIDGEYMVGQRLHHLIGQPQINAT
jgi:hypothetical protein